MGCAGSNAAAATSENSQKEAEKNATLNKERDFKLSASVDLNQQYGLDKVKRLEENPEDQKDDVPIDFACFGAGCYWGTEKFFLELAGKKIIASASSVGFMGPEGSSSNPSYEEVCRGSTGHVEVYKVTFKGGIDTFKLLVKAFFQFHDPTTMNRQGNDRGTQYASAIYCNSVDQLEAATDVKQELQNLLDQKIITPYVHSKVTTDIRRYTQFYPAKSEHQKYLMINPRGYCNHKIRFGEWPTIDT